MALLVADTRREEFSKPPPPKKKWLQEYIEQDSQASSISSNLSTEAREFVRLFDNQTDEDLNSNLKNLSDSKDSPGKITLSQDLIGGVVQGVLNQFQSYFENECSSGASASFENKASAPVSSALKVKKLSKLLDPARNGAKLNESMKRLSWPGSCDDKTNSADIPDVNEDLKISQNDIAPVVQSVISQFLNGSLADSDFRRSRKRSHKHANCHHRDRSGFSGPTDRNKRSSSVIQFKSKTPENKIFKDQPSEGVIVPSLKLEPSEEVDENQALNLSLPKHNQKVTFATQDRCYSTESVKSFQTSKSEELTNLDILAHASDDCTKMNTHEDQKPNVSQIESLHLVGKTIRSVISTSQESEQRYYDQPKSYIELTPVIRHTHDSPMNMALPMRTEDNTFRPIVRNESYGSHSPLLQEVVRSSQFVSLPSSHQTSPVCLKKSGFPYSGQPSHSPPLSSILYPSAQHPSIFSISPSSHSPSLPISLTTPLSSSQAHHFNSTSPHLSPNSHSPSQHTITPPPHSVLRKADPVNLSCERASVPLVYSYPVIKPKPINPFHESTELKSKPIFANAYYSKPQLNGSYSTSDTNNQNNKTIISPTSTNKASREKSETVAKEEIKRTSSSTREVHNRLEKNRRAHLKLCFDELAAECDLDPKKASNLTVIRSAYKYIMSLRRKERENEKNLANLVQEKIRRQNLLEELKREFPGYKSESDCE